MADKPKTNVDKFFEIYDADPALQARVQQAMAASTSAMTSSGKRMVLFVVCGVRGI